MPQYILSVTIMARIVFLCFLPFIFWTSLHGCAAAPAPLLASSGDSNLAELLESIRVEERLPALAAAVIIDGDIYAAAAVGTRKFGSENWVTVDDSFLIASCSKAFTATLAAILNDQFGEKWWVDRKLPIVMRSTYLKEKVNQELADEPDTSVYYYGCNKYT